MPINLPKSKNLNYCVFVFSFFIVSNFVGNAQVGIGNSNPDSSSILDMTSTTQGLLTSRMTNSERDAILDPATGLLIFNTTTSHFNYFDQVWKEYSDYTNYFNVSSTSDNTTSSIMDELLPSMTLAPSMTGTYELIFNCTYNNSPKVEIIPPGSTPSTLAQQASSDLATLTAQLNSLTVTNSGHDAAFGNGETIGPGVYSIAGAASIALSLTLNGGGDTNAIFVIKANGALAAGAGTNVILTNGAEARNVFWLATGAISFGANSIMKGTVISDAPTAAIAFNAGGNLEGRLLTKAGAITFGPAVANLPSGTCPYSLGVLKDFVIYTGNGAVDNTSASTITGFIGTNLGAITGFETATVNGAYITDTTFTSTIPITKLTPNTNAVLASFSIYRDGILIPASSAIVSSQAYYGNVSIRSILNLEAGKSIDIRWKTDLDKIVVGNRNFTIIKFQ